jgi:hypothetical protein
MVSTDFVTNSIHVCNLLVFASTTLQNSHSRNTWRINHLRAVLCQQNKYVFMYNVSCKIILPCNQLSVSTFKECCHAITLVFLLSNFTLKFHVRISRSNERGHHLVYGSKGAVEHYITAIVAVSLRQRFCWRYFLA